MTATKENIKELLEAPTDRPVEYQSGFVFGKRSRENLKGVHPDLVKVMLRALELTDIDFMVTEGVRTKERQASLLKNGKSKTMNSRHLGGFAVDIAALVDNKVCWDWPLYERLAVFVKQASEDVEVPIIWGGDWTSFKDGVHFELPRSHYK